MTIEVLTLIGDTLSATGDRAGAERAWSEALDLSADGQTAAALELRDRLWDSAGELSPER